MVITTTNPPNSSSQRSLTLHHLSDSQSLRILWALEELTATSSLPTPYTLIHHIRIHARAPPEVKSIHPLGKCPILVVSPAPDSPAQEKPTVLTESRLILQYLSDNYAAPGTWDPQDDAASARRSAFWQEFAAATLDAAVDRVLLFDIIPPHVPWVVRPLAGAIFNPLAGIHRKGLPDMFAMMEEALSEEEPWFAGRELGLADFVISWPMDKAVQRGYFEGGKWPRLNAWLNSVHGREAYKRALELGGSYDLVSFGYGR